MHVEGPAAARSTSGPGEVQTIWPSRSPRAARADVQDSDGRAPRRRRHSLCAIDSGARKPPGQSGPFDGRLTLNVPAALPPGQASPFNGHLSLNVPAALPPGCR